MRRTGGKRKGGGTARGLGGDYASSSVIPVSINRDGSLSKRSGAVSPADFSFLLSYAERMTGDLAREIMTGKTAPDPWMSGNTTACDYCAFRSVCGFDPKLPGAGYRMLMPVDRETFFSENEVPDEVDN